MSHSIQEIGKLIAKRLREERERLKASWAESGPVRHFAIDDLLPPEMVQTLASVFPDRGVLVRRASLRETKAVGVDLEKYDSLVGNVLLSFQIPEVIEEVSAITSLAGLESDPTLYASGVSSMGPGDFLNPHLDNSHDGDRARYRVLNLLYYCTDDWKKDFGGNLELWDENVRRSNVIEAKFNRLVVMGTDPKSWHSVSRVTIPRFRNCCSNYYFSRVSPTGSDYFHVTSFRGRPEEPLRDLCLRADGMLRNLLRTFFPQGVKGSFHRRQVVETQA